MLRLLNYCVKLLEPLSAQQPLLMRCIILYRRHRHPPKIPRTLDPISPIWLSSTGKTPPVKLVLIGNSPITATKNWKYKRAPVVR